jgi:hypothetical protein
LDPSALYRLEADTDASSLRASVLMVSLVGFMDAGNTQRLLTDHLLATLDHTVVATFDVDQLLDYRGRRPVMTFEQDHWSAYADPSLVLYRLIDDKGAPFLLLNGPEPDYQWERVIEAVRRLIRLAGVSLTVSVHGVPMAVPHTRPVGISEHATHPGLRKGHPPVFGTLQVPGSMSALLELRLGEAGEQAMGYAVHVPHYLAQSEFPAGALAGLEALVAATGLAAPDTALRVAAAENLKAIGSEVQQTDEAAQVVAALEQQYDTFVAGRQRRALLVGDETQLPTADELGQEFEAFLRQQADDEA